jgi:hypothetical protein
MIPAAQERAARTRYREMAAPRAFSGKVDTGFPSENATTHEEVERFPIQSNREAL